MVLFCLFSVPMYFPTYFRVNEDAVSRKNCFFLAKSDLLIKRLIAQQLQREKPLDLIGPPDRDCKSKKTHKTFWYKNCKYSLYDSFLSYLCVADSIFLIHFTLWNKFT